MRERERNEKLNMGLGFEAENNQNLKNFALNFYSN